MLAVLKLGGSLLGDPLLGDWLSAAANGGGRLLVVPGGGTFANAVRHAQAASGCSEGCAHHLALLAMEQYGRLLCDLQPGLVPCATPVEIAAVRQRGETPVWLPARMCLDNTDIEASWRVTSDSLAAWLAQCLRAEVLWLVKHGRPVGGDWSALARAGVVDAAFASHAGRYAGHIGCLRHDRPSTLTAWLAGQGQACAA
jgi:dihydroneopterin aldolase